ncbi:5220_t:CDS:2, partial [Dentiscutata heterogama]
DVSMGQNKEDQSQNEPLVIISIPSIIDKEFSLSKGWVLKGNQKLGNRGGARIKKNIRAKLEGFFLNGNRVNKDKISAKAMHAELLKFVEMETLKQRIFQKLPQYKIG